MLTRGHQELMANMGYIFNQERMFNSFHSGGLKSLFTISKLNVLCGGGGGTAARHQPHAASRTSNSLGMSNATSKAM